MFKKALVIVGVIGAVMAAQAPAQASGTVQVGFQKAHHISDKGFHGHRHGRHFKGKHYRGKHHRGFRPFVMSNREIRFMMRSYGMRRIHIHSRSHGVARLTAITPRGHLARFRVSTFDGQILGRRIIRPAHYYDRPYHGRRGGGRFTINF
ncbi:MAG: hypothetical protein AAGE61_21705 [Pseudomonadota bacterium]